MPNRGPSLAARLSHGQRDALRKAYKRDPTKFQVTCNRCGAAWRGSPNSWHVCPQDIQTFTLGPFWLAPDDF